MAIEIELKAHVEDCESMKTTLEGKAESSFYFEKEDVYWSLNEAIARLAPHFISKIRIRREKRRFSNGKVSIGNLSAGSSFDGRFSDGAGESLCLATYKKKEVQDGIEVNDEHEFEIRSSSGDAAKGFEEFLKGIGMKPGASKKKRGWAFIIEGKQARPGLGNICAELVEVEGLGWFAELEILADKDAAEGAVRDAVTDREELLAEGKKRLLDFLDSLGIGRQAIESRYYTEMLENLHSVPTPAPG